MSELKIEINDLSLLAMNCAENVYSVRPSQAYAAAVASMLVGTAIHESGGLKYNRQYRYGFDQHSGAWGICQIEEISVRESLRQLARRPAVRARAHAWLFDDARAANCSYLSPGKERDILRLMAVSPRASILFARLHYLWEKGKIPADLRKQAVYWDEKYNRNPNAGTPEEFISSVTTFFGRLA